MNICFAGLDWASQTHAECLIDAHGAICEHFDITKLRCRLTAGSQPIAIERSSGLLVDTLVEASFTVVGVARRFACAVGGRR